MRRFLIAVAACTFAATDVTVETSFGKLQGNRPFLQGCDQYLGIPFAKAPVGNLRFEAPVPWEQAYPKEGRKATSFSKSCPQMGLGDEDCLYLNVWRPSGNESRMASLVFLYGGAFISGGASASILSPVPPVLNLYDGCGLASTQKLIVATLNYRLGALGFAAFEEEGTASSNFGMKDQRQALAWLQSELPAFGGDPSRVTLFGESAGAMSVMYHVASPASKGLFRGAISQSGMPAAWSWEEARDMTNRFAAAMNCTDRSQLKACLRKFTTKDIVAKQFAPSNPLDFPVCYPPWQPAVDGSDELPKYPWALFKEQRTSAVPMMAGSNTDEATLFQWPFYERGMNASQFNDLFENGVVANYAAIEALSDAEKRSILDLYSQEGFDADDHDKRWLAVRIATDAAFHCATKAMGQVYNGSFWHYRFNHRSACQAPLTPLLPGVYHTAELQYVWGVQWKLACPFLPAESSLSQRMQTMWGNFAKCLDPTCGREDIIFPKYTNGAWKSLVFQSEGDVIEEKNSAERCGLWDELVYEKYRGRSGGPTIGNIVV